MKHLKFVSLQKNKYRKINLVTIKKMMKKKLLILFAIVTMGLSNTFAQSDDYLCFTAEEPNATVSFSAPDRISMEISNDKKTWKAYALNSVINLEKKGDKVYFRTSSDKTLKEFTTEWETCRFILDGPLVAASGNVMSLLDKTCSMTSLEGMDRVFERLFADCKSLTMAPKLPATILSSYCYCCMFTDCYNLRNAPELPAVKMEECCYQAMFAGCESLEKAVDLPSTDLAEQCYYRMFEDCRLITESPKLPAKSLAKGCYYSMFENCSSLETVNTISAEILAEGCCASMFDDCISLVKAPKLPAMTLAEDCYNQMFCGCKNMKEAPELPATKLKDRCYYMMFKGCGSLEKAPVLPAKKMEICCYFGMFSWCVKLKATPELPATTLADDCYYYMFASSGLTTLPDLPAKILKPNCYEGMFSDCKNLIINSEAPGKKWSIAKGTSDDSANDWNMDMFKGTSGNFTGNPQIGVTYYVLSDKETTGIPNVKADNLKLSFKVIDNGKIHIVNGNKKYTVSGLETE